jgi:hypothetical protein
MEHEDDEDAMQLKPSPVQRMEDQELEDDSPLQAKLAGSTAPVQREAGEEAVPRENRTGMPDQLKTNLESMSGFDLSDVRVHRNSDKPAQLSALAYAQGNEIHLGPGQEQHLPHEAWHVVQQRQGRVAPTTQMAGVGVNDDVELEREADMATSVWSVTKFSDRPVLGQSASELPVQLVGLPEDSSGSMEQAKIDGRSETGAELQKRLIRRLSDIVSVVNRWPSLSLTPQGGYRLCTYKYRKEGAKDKLSIDIEHRQENHGMPKFPMDIVTGSDIDIEIKELVVATLKQANQWGYLTNNFDKIGMTSDVLIDVDWYISRTQDRVGFHKDSRGTTMFVNLTYDNEEEMQSAEKYDDLDGVPELERGFPSVVKEDLEVRRKKMVKESRGLLEIGSRRLPRYGRVSFSDPSVWHSTPRLGRRITKDSFNAHGISSELQLSEDRKEMLRGRAARLPRRLSMELLRGRVTSEELGAEALKPRGFIRSWVRVVPKQ